MKKLFIALLSLSILNACKSNDSDPVDPEITDAKKQEVVDNYANIVLANYEDAITTAEALQTAIHEFVANPTAAGLEACKTAWLESRNPYLQTEAFRFYDGPIDGTDENFEGLINAWPLDEAYIDYVEGDTTAGVINNTADYPTISEAVLLADNEKNGETDVKVGYHAIEFLLWGQDLYADSPGKRPYTDYLEGGTAANPVRRGQYLTIVADLLVKDLKSVKSQWESNGAYRTEFVKATNLDQSILNILNGMGKLSKGELSGERMAVILASKDQEDEHSCFSDNTHNDYLFDEIGIYNVYLGKYTRIDGTVVEGTGFDDLLMENHAAVNTAMIAKLDAAVAAIKALPDPIDTGLTTNEEAFKTAITAIRAQADQLVEVATALGMNFNIPESNG
ncbi:putative iron-regulated protein [Dyadobacter jejuensis]|uniref:Putative iron-regulated protein n=1 Tax=Dyadobacter jejuensis TaxID=1082580 RepID=A0A316AKV5_9BACT|nr:imelysin family protein [Dyadobacter jejuensis]PWJ58008.1 putative iron-regulated protein [Dyadobacter jejuensis]